MIEGYPSPTHVVPLGSPREAGRAERWRVVRADDETGRDVIAPYVTDAASFPGGYVNEVVDFLRDATANDVAQVLQQYNHQGRSVVAIGAQTSLTGASVPMGDTVFNLSRLKHISLSRDGEDHFATVQPGVTWDELQRQLTTQNLFAPTAPTYVEASVIGGINTNAGGASCYKYGSVRSSVQALQVVLTSGELLDIRRGQYQASSAADHPQYPGGVFELQATTGETRYIRVPTYPMPEVPKISAGYYAEPEMDLIDLFIGSEGTLGIITAATIKVAKEPKSYMALVDCDTDEDAFELINQLRTANPEAKSFDPNDVRAVEYMGTQAVELVRHKNRAMLQQAGALLLVQLEINGADPLESFVEFCETNGVNTERIVLAAPEDTNIKQDLIAIRELIPMTVNETVRALQRDDPAITKVGADPCVKPKFLGAMMKIFAEEFGRDDLRYITWGHGEGNLHPNVIPRTAAEVQLAKAAIIRAGTRIIKDLDGAGTAEHGVGKNETKQTLLSVLYGRQGINEMRTVKAALDPQHTLAPGNIFARADG